MEAPVCIKEGSLVKLGSKYKTWRRRHFVLTGGDNPTLCYYSSPKQASVVVSMPLGSLEMSSCVAVRYLSESRIQGRHMYLFELEFPGRTLIAASNTSDDREEWISLLSRCANPSCNILRHPPRPKNGFTKNIVNRQSQIGGEVNDNPYQPDDTIAGTLFTLGRKVKEWKKRWVVLRYNTLFFYKDEHTKGKVAYLNLFDCHGVGEHTAAAYQNTFELVTKQRLILLRAENCESMNCWLRIISRVISTAKRPTITEDEDTHVIQTSSELTAMVVQPILLRGSFEEGFDSDSLEGEFL
eukprot:gene1694-4818_t